MGGPPARPRVVAFDVNETLFSLDGLGPRFEEAGLPASMLGSWFMRTLRDGFAFAAAGDWRPFGEVARRALEAQGAADGAVVSLEAWESILAGLELLDPHPDVQPAFAHLVAAGVPVVTLTNGSLTHARRLLTRAGLDGSVSRTLSAEEVGHWKPRPEPYRHAAAAMGVEPGQLALVTAHGWDVLGAARAGLVTGWVSRLEGTFGFGPPAPDVSGTSLVDVVEGLLAGGHR